MGKIKKILENELTLDNQSTEVYPVTSIKAVYDENNERLDNFINRKNNEIQKELDDEVVRATNAENNLRETINNITEISGSATTANIVTIDTIPNTSSSNVQQALNELFTSKATKRVGKNLFTGENITKGYINHAGGISGTTGVSRTTDYIKVDSNLIANYNQLAGTNNAVYDANKKFLRTFNTANYTYQEGDAFVRYSFNSDWLKNYMIEKGDVATEYEPYTEDAPLLEYVLQNKNLIKESNKVLLNIPIDKVFIGSNATGGVIERDFGIDVPKTASVSQSVVQVRMKKGLELKGNYTLSCYFITNQPSSKFAPYNQTIEQLGKGLVKISYNFSKINTYGYDIIASVAKNSETDTYLRLAKVVLETEDIQIIQKLKQLDIPKETRTIFNVSKDFDETTIDFGVFNYNNIIDAHKNVINSSETNQYVIRCMPGLYDEFEEEWAGSDEESGSDGSYLGISVQDYEYFESFDKECPELTTLKWDGSAGFSTSMTHLQAARRCIFHINMKNKHTKIEGFSFDCKNVRYCIHPETAGQGWGNKWHIKNCILKFSGRPFVQPADPSWAYIGTGLSNGEHGIIERCKFIENEGKQAIYVHNNPFNTSIIKKEISIKVGARLDIIQCDFGNKLIEILTTTSNVADTYDVCEIVGCKNNAGVSVKPHSDGSQNWKVSLINSDGDIQYVK